MLSISWGSKGAYQGKQECGLLVVLLLMLPICRFSAENKRPLFPCDSASADDKVLKSAFLDGRNGISMG